jgi:hypothetical protein
MRPLAAAGLAWAGKGCAWAGKGCAGLGPVLFVSFFVFVCFLLLFFLGFHWQGGAQAWRGRLGAGAGVPHVHCVFPVCFFFVVFLFWRRLLTDGAQAMLCRA